MARYGFSSSQRLRRPGEFDAVFKQAQLRVSHPAFLFLARPNGMDCCRLGVVVGKRAAAKAVDRNRLKRLIRESFRQHCTLRAVDLVVVARPAARDYANGQLLETLNRSFSELATRQARQSAI